jgi:NAD(P)H-hydrate epimerase
MNVPLLTDDSLEDLAPCDLVIDGIIGYSLSGAPSGTAAMMIEWANRSGIEILSLDVPSGMDASAGVVHSPVIKATATLTLALPKTGLQSEDFLQYTGELYLADISVPPELYGKPPINMPVGPLFARDDVLRIC